MEKIQFNVSSKTARLIGRENISDSNGAIIELVKNAYDADADSVYINFDIIFENIPENIYISEIKKYFSEDEFNYIISCYNQEGDKLTKKSDLTVEQNEIIKNILFSKNKIIIFDNGTGMNEKIIKTVWMNIGTRDKEINTYSKKGRIKTGAKGIGRFALEKLSQKTTVFTKTEDDQPVYWNINWMQFDERDSLNEITADISVLNSNFNELISQHIKFDDLNKREIKSGTLIILTGTREIWSDRIYNRINNNLNSINPFGNVDKFNVYVKNIRKSKFDYIPKNSNLSEDDYDYIIEANYDGNENVSIKLTRNEINLTAKVAKIEIENKIHELDIDSFWEREAFKIPPYKKENYAEVYAFNQRAIDLMTIPVSIEEIKKIGKFSLKLYFLKSGNSDFHIIKEVKVNKRKELLKLFSGVKIYRDNFKVRPYGEEGPMYDWLQLGSRVQNSPAGITHPTGAWRVNTYQLIGSVNISRINNPNLEDMANREGLALNDTYYLFVDLITNIISKFEFDRQYVYREYRAWLKKYTDSKTTVKKIQQEIRNEKENKKITKNEYSEEEYKDAIYDSMKEQKHSIDTQRILMNFSSVGMAANTFAHEMQSVSTNLATRNQQLKMCIDILLNKREYVGPEHYNPYLELENGQKHDILLSKWLKLIMDSTKQVNTVKGNLSLLDFFKELYDDWNGLLEKKSIKLNVPNENDCIINCEKIDLFLIFNNLILNSAYFLEKEVNGSKRLINISYKEEKDNVFFTFENNGPKLDEKYVNSPNLIFEPGETTKENGTGLGLWICKDSVTRNNGEIGVIPCDVGFKIEIKWPKVS